MSILNDLIKHYEKEIVSSFGPAKYNGSVPGIPVFKNDTPARKRELQKENAAITRLFDKQRPGTWFKGVPLLQPLPGDSPGAVRHCMQYNQKARAFNSLGGDLMKKIQFALNAEASERGSRPANFAYGSDPVTILVNTAHLLAGLCKEHNRLESNRSKPILAGLDPYIRAQMEKLESMNTGPGGLVALKSAVMAERGKSEQPKKVKTATPTGTEEKTWDPVTDKRIAHLDARVRQSAISFINTVESQLSKKLRITQGLRTIAEQDGLYAQGRSKPGKKVTNAKGGESYHNYGLALDVAEMIDGRATWDTDWEGIAKIGKKLGFEWGGDFRTIVDKPHFQMSFGQSITQLKQTLRR